MEFKCGAMEDGRPWNFQLETWNEKRRQRETPYDILRLIEPGAVKYVSSVVDAGLNLVAAFGSLLGFGCKHPADNGSNVGNGTTR